MRIYCDSSTKEACFVIGEQETIILTYDQQVTGNEGEYLAVIAALTEMRERKQTNILILTDSQLVVNQVNGVWKCNYRHLQKRRDWVRILAQELQATVEWIPREENLAGRVLG